MNAEEYYWECESYQKQVEASLDPRAVVQLESLYKTLKNDKVTKQQYIRGEGWKFSVPELWFSYCTLENIAETTEKFCRQEYPSKGNTRLTVFGIKKLYPMYQFHLNFLHSQPCSSQ